MLDLGNVCFMELLQVTRSRCGEDFLDGLTNRVRDCSLHPWATAFAGDHFRDVVRGKPELPGNVAHRKPLSDELRLAVQWRQWHRVPLTVKVRR